MSDLHCPYCDAGNDVCHDDGHGYEENKKHEMYCRSCDKAFVFQTSIIYYYEAEKADCLNGGEHILKVSNTYPRRYARMCCQTCDYEEPLPKDHPYRNEPKIVI